MTRRFWVKAGLAMLAVATAAGASAAAPKWTANDTTGRITFAGTHAGAAFTGTFRKWAASIEFDPANLAQSRVRVVIDKRAAAIGDQMKDTTLQGDEWFASKAHPLATFVSTDIRAAGPGRYVARGALTLKGKAVPVTLPFTLKIAGNKATMNAKIPLDRTALDLGQKSDPQGSWVSKSIDLTIALSATRAP